MMSKPVSGTSPWLLQRLLPPGFCPDTHLHDELLPRNVRLNNSSLPKLLLIMFYHHNRKFKRAGMGASSGWDQCCGWVHTVGGALSLAGQHLPVKPQVLGVSGLRATHRHTEPWSQSRAGLHLPESGPRHRIYVCARTAFQHILFLLRKLLRSRSPFPGALGRHVTNMAERKIIWGWPQGIPRAVHLLSCLPLLSGQTHGNHLQQRLMNLREVAHMADLLQRSLGKTSQVFPEYHCPTPG